MRVEACGPRLEQSRPSLWVAVATRAPAMVDGCFMIPLEGGGAVPHAWMRAAMAADLGVNPCL